jgi:hypothetical protein
MRRGSEIINERDGRLTGPCHAVERLADCSRPSSANCLAVSSELQSNGSTANAKQRNSGV